MSHNGTGVAGFSAKRLHVAGSRQHNGLAPGASWTGSPVAGYLAWYDAAQITGAADNTALASWPDLSANGYGLVQATGANKPTYYKTTGAKLVNGLPAVWFNGTSDLMNTSNSSITVASPAVISWVFWAQTLTTQELFNAFNLVNGITATHYTENYGSGILNGGTPETTRAHTVTYTCSTGGTSTIRVDGTQVATTTGLGGSTGSLYMTLGAQSGGGVYFNGAICECVIYSASTLTLANVQANEAYLKAKWGTP